MTTTKTRYNFDSFTLTAIIVLAVGCVFLIWQSEGKEVNAVTKQSGTACFKN